MSDDWATDASAFQGGANAASSSVNGGSVAADDVMSRTEKVQSRLKTIYKKAVLPVEKRFRYDYFYESPFLSDVEFDCKC